MESSEFLSKLSKRVLLYVVATAVVTTVASLVTYSALVGQNFDSIHKRIDDSNKMLGSQISNLDEGVEMIGAKIDQIDEDLLFVREFVSEVDALEDKLGYGPALVDARLERLPVGGPGSVPVPEFPTYTKELPFNSSQAEIDNWKSRLGQLLEMRLATDRRFQFDEAQHEVQVFENVVVPLDAEQARLDLTAVTVFRE